MHHTVIEGVDNVLFEVIAARMSGHHAKPPLFVKLIEGDPENVHFDARGDECKHRFYVRECPCADRSGRRTGRPAWNGDREGRAPCREFNSVKSLAILLSGILMPAIVSGMM